MSRFHQYVKYTSLAIQMLLYLFLFIYGGYKLDDFFQMETRWFTIGGAIWAVLSMMVYLVVKYMKNQL